MNQYQIDGWHVLQLGLSIGATASAVTAAVWGLWKLGKRWWYSTFGLRKAQAAILDQFDPSRRFRRLYSLNHPAFGGVRL